jgi:hypothetical protein
MESDSRQIEIYRRMNSRERIAVACGLHDFAHQRVVLCLREQFPDKTEREILIEAACRFLPESAAILRTLESPVVY